MLSFPSSLSNERNDNDNCVRREGEERRGREERRWQSRSLFSRQDFLFDGLTKLNGKGESS